MTLFGTIEVRLSEMPQQPLTTADHGPCMNCSFERKDLIEFYGWLFGVMSPENYARLDQAVMRHGGVTHYDHFLPLYKLPKTEFLEPEKNTFWCVKVATFLAALREALEHQVN